MVFITKQALNLLQQSDKCDRFIIKNTNDLN